MELVDTPILRANNLYCAAVAELVYARDSKSRSVRIVGSSPTRGTIQIVKQKNRVSESCLWQLARESFRFQLLLKYESSGVAGCDQPHTRFKSAQAAPNFEIINFTVLVITYDQIT